MKRIWGAVCSRYEEKKKKELICVCVRNADDDERTDYLDNRN